MKFIDREPVRFVFAGGLNAIATYGTYLVLLPLIGYAIAYSVAYVGGIFLAYYLSARLVFRRPLQWRHAVQYPLIYVVQYGLGIILTTAFVERLHVRAEFALALVIAITVPVMFLLARWIIKREKKPTSPSTPLNSNG
jgi:putative flippase GtrA